MTRRWWAMAALATLGVALVSPGVGRAGLFTATPQDFALGPYRGTHGYSYNVAYGYALPFSPLHYSPWIVPFPYPPYGPPPRPAYSRFFYPQLYAAPLRPALPAAVADGVCVIEVRVPADAEVSFDGAPASQAGEVRVFTSPVLEKGKEYLYVVRARWTEGGRPVDQMQVLPVVAGGHFAVSFTRP